MLFRSINVPGYTASKSGLLGLMKAFANEWAGQGINVNAVAPYGEWIVPPWL